GQGLIATCQVGTSVQLSADLAGSIILGTGTNVVSLSGKCGSFTSNVQNIEIAGTRISSDQNLGGPPLTLLTSFAPFSSTIAGGKAVNVSTQMSVTGTGFLFSRVTRLFSGTLTVRNTGTRAVGGPVQIVLTNLPAGVTLANGTGMTNGNPFI